VPSGPVRAGPLRRRPPGAGAGRRQHARRRAGRAPDLPAGAVALVPDRAVPALLPVLADLRPSPPRHLLGRPLDRRRRLRRRRRRRGWRRLGRRRWWLLRRRLLGELVMELFDKAQQARIAEAVAAAELRSRGEIVPAVVPRSAAYLEALDRGGIAGLLLASAIYLGIQTGWSEPSVMTLLLAQAAGFVAGWLLAHIPALARLLVGRKSMET